MMLTTFLLASSIALQPSLNPLQDPEKELEEKVDAFKDLVKGKENEPILIAHIDGFLTLYAESFDRFEVINEDLELGSDNSKELKKEKKALEKRMDTIASSVWTVFRRKKVTKENMDVWKAASFAFGRMHIHGAEYLWKAFEDKRFNRDVEFRSLCTKQVGYTKDYSQAEELQDLLDYKDILVVAAAAEALSQFGEAPGAVRLESTKQLVKKLESYHNSSMDYEDTNAVRDYRTIRDPFVKALSVFTQQSFRDPLDWTRWWNKNKKDRDLWRDERP